MIIERRTYTVQPGSVATVEGRFGQALPARAKLSPLATFWHTEVGPLNRVIHVWAYDSFEERTRIRAESQKLEGWPPNIREFNHTRVRFRPANLCALPRRSAYASPLRDTASIGHHATLRQVERVGDQPRIQYLQGADHVEDVQQGAGLSSGPT